MQFLLGGMIFQKTGGPSKKDLPNVTTGRCRMGQHDDEDHDHDHDHDQYHSTIEPPFMDEEEENPAHYNSEHQHSSWWNKLLSRSVPRSFGLL
jgi:hypothetical protein